MEIMPIIIYIINILIMEDKLLQRIEKLEKSVEILKSTIRQILVNTESKIEVPNRLVSSIDTKVPKDRVFLQSILERSTNPSSQKFLQSLINSNYDTLTIKQKLVVDNIVEQL